MHFLTGRSAALNADIARWIEPAGLLIIEGRGMAETRAATVREPADTRHLRVPADGQPLPGT